MTAQNLIHVEPVLNKKSRTLTSVSNESYLN